MSERATTFLNSWIFENINAGPYDPGDAVIAPLIEKLLADAQAEGILRKELEEDSGTVRDIITTVLNEATNNEIGRLASKDD